MRLADVGKSIRIDGVVLTGTEAQPVGGGQALRIFTRGAVPDGADAVVRVEDIDESDHTIRLTAGVQLRLGDNIRRCGENVRAGKIVVERGRLLDAAVIASADNVRCNQPSSSATGACGRRRQG